MFGMIARHGAAWLVQGKPFALGWIEGVQRAALGGDLVPASRFDRGSVPFAASEAALAYCLSVRGA